MGQISGGDKPHPYLFGETSFVVAGFIPACRRQPATSSLRQAQGLSLSKAAESNVEKIAQLRYQKERVLISGYHKANFADFTPLSEL